MRYACLSPFAVGPSCHPPLFRISHYALNFSPARRNAAEEKSTRELHARRMRTYFTDDSSIHSPSHPSRFRGSRADSTRVRGTRPPPPTPPRFIIAAFAPENSWLYLEYITIQHFAPDRFLKLYEIKNAHNTNKRRPQFVNCSKQSSPTLSAGADGRIAITVFPAIVQAHRSETSVNL